MGGDVVLAPATGRGACFVTTIPLRAAGAQDDAREAAPATSRSGPLAILVAEDTPTNQLVIRLMLEGLGHRVHLAANGVEAVEAFEAGGFDLVVLDIQMPLMDGFEAARRIRASGARGSEVSILALTAFTQPSDRDEAARCGIDGFLSKPVRQKDLAEAVARSAGALHRKG
jgi:CheY-like chemotaxis protein